MTDATVFPQASHPARPERAAIVGIQETSEDGEATATITLT
jgi:hypothetical protein